MNVKAIASRVVLSLCLLGLAAWVSPANAQTSRTKRAAPPKTSATTKPVPKTAPAKPIIPANAKVVGGDTGGINEETLAEMQATTRQRRDLATLVAILRPRLQRILENKAMLPETKAQQIALYQQVFRENFIGLLTAKQKTIFERREKDGRTLVGDSTTKSPSAPTAAVAKSGIIPGGSGRFQLELPKDVTTQLQLTPEQDTRLRTLYAGLKPMMAKVMADKKLADPQKLNRINSLRDGFYRQFLAILTPLQRERIRPPQAEMPTLRGAISPQMLAALDFQTKQVEDLGKVMNDLEPKIAALQADTKMKENDKKKKFLEYQTDFRNRFLKIMNKEQRAKFDAMEKAAQARG